ncbi:hypothetical protein [Ascidiimonas aurantiaca]|uniref:hypothetical protein n=1 Tax=Ascidiimonas aurantiaca TaxID=1685432 RepID=UPI0030EF40FE
MSIDDSIKSFATFLNSSWSSAILFLKDNEEIKYSENLNNWFQANWELLVEQKVLNSRYHLEVYGYGADFYGASSRITDIESLPDFQIVVNQKSDSSVLDVLNDEKIKIVNANFIHLVSFKNEFYYLEPNFEYVLIEHPKGKERVVSVNDIEFNIIKLNDH